MARLARLREILSREGLEALVVSKSVNRRYLSGFTGTSGLLCIGQEKAFLLTDFRYTEQAQAQAPEFEVRKSGFPIWTELAKVAQEMGWHKLGFEAHDLSYSQAQALKEACPGAEPRQGLVEELRILKDEQEVQFIAEAAALTDQAYLEILPMLQEGRKETEIALELEFILRRLGASGISFDFIVASGPRGALPHGVASEKTLAKGEMITLDFGCIYKGYCSDMTRTVALGDPGPKAREIYELTLRAQEAALAALAPGKTGKEIDEVARKIISDAGYGEAFGHGLGHGVGMEIHEEPRLSLQGERVLTPGMVVTIEPGVYLPQFGGVRIEDLCLVTEEGAQRLSNSPKEWQSI